MVLMLFSSSVFLYAFLPLVLALYYTVLRGRRNAQNIFLTIASLFFYTWGEPSFSIIMMLLIVVNWAIALWVEKARGDKLQTRLALGLTCLANFGVLFVFKYLMFTVSVLNKLTSLGVPVPQILLPIGVSFFTFQAFSYVMDVYHKNGEAQKNPMNVALYICFFPQLVAGPIVQYQDIFRQIQGRKESFEDFAKGACRLVIGLGKKVILANSFALVADAAFKTPHQSVAMAWLGALGYTFQIFYDFSGYSDMALGLGKMFGFTFLENFDYPYISKSISEFWRRWHISLGMWFRTYVYIPLGGSRVKTKSRLVFNLFVVWFLTGAWHGAHGVFFFWGLMYFVLIAAEKLLGYEKKIGWFGHVYTLFFVIIGWVFFRSPSMEFSFRYIASMFGIHATGLIDPEAIFYFRENIVYFALAVLFSMPFGKWIGKAFEGNRVAQAAYVAGLSLLLVTSISFIVKGSYNPFIYFNF